MVSLNSNPPEAIFHLDPSGMALPELDSLSSPVPGSIKDAALEDPSKKVRKPYTITKSRESWTEPEHDKFVEALQLFERDWKKIEAFIGSKTVIQIRSHAQKYFLKVQKSGTHEHLPPPRPKRKAAHPYPQKATKIEVPSAQTSTSVPDPRSLWRPDSSAVHLHPEAALTASSWTGKPVKGESGYVGQPLLNVYSSGSIESTPRTKTAVLPDFGQVYSFIGSIFDPNTSGHLQKLKKMDAIDIETVLLLMRNLSFNLASPEFEHHRRLLSSYEVDASDPITRIPSQNAA